MTASSAVEFLVWLLISATDPISVPAIFKDLRIDKRLSLIMEAESLLNDGTADYSRDATLAESNSSANRTDRSSLEVRRGLLGSAAISLCVYE